ncbi:MAG: hypothetical protein LW690_08035 [Opitutaceae bacterium]|jgi:hypothetical protein|nr:hypothetical protein [Opitutaceae bacterium]
MHPEPLRFARTLLAALVSASARSTSAPKAPWQLDYVARGDGPSPAMIFLFPYSKGLYRGNIAKP